MERFKVMHILLVSTTTIFSRAESSAGTPCDIHAPDQTDSSTGTSSWKINTEEATATLQPLPRDSDTFRDIMKGKKVFVDKTYMIDQLLELNSRCVLFTRPRRFGKTMFIRMLQEFFQGNSKFFRGTNISSRGNTDDKNGKWKKYPVIYFDFEKIYLADTKPSIELFRQRLSDFVQGVADLNKVSHYCERTGKCRDLGRLIQTLYFKFKMTPVVVLIDEYDSVFVDEKLSAGTEVPLISLLKKRRPNLVRLMETELDTFFLAIKSNIKYIKLVFVTGVSKLNFTSTFQGEACNFVDISMDYPTMAGFSMNELKGNFWPHIERIAKTKNMTTEEVTQKLQEMYDGYRFSITDETKVLNPISTIDCLKTCVFGSFSLSTASLQSIVQKIIKSGVSVHEFKKLVIPQEDVLRRYSPTSVPLSVTLLLYGYLTINEVDHVRSTLTLDFPNKEVEEALNNAVLIAQKVKHPEEILSENGKRLRLSLKNQDMKGFMTCMNNIGFKNLGGQSEFSQTRVVNAILRQGGILTEVGKSFFDDGEGKRRGLQILSQQNHYVMEIQCNMLNAIEGMLQLIKYIVEYESEFRQTLLKFRDDVISGAKTIYEDYNIFLISTKIKRNKFEDFISLPYRIKRNGSGELCLGRMKMISANPKILELKEGFNTLAKIFPNSNLLNNVENFSCVLL